jgi:PadR family transcriptional regulator AphA
MSLQHGILGLLSYGPKSGYDLVKIFGESLAHFWGAQSSQIYRELDSLSAKGLAEPSKKVQRGHLTKTLHRITEAGRTELFRWLGEDPAGGSHAVRSTLLIKLFFQARLGKTAVGAMLADLKTRSKAEAERLRTAAGEAVERYSSRATPLEAFCWKATLDYGIANYEMQSRWAAQKLAELETIEDSKPDKGD